ncbi:uncharacterized protein LOC129746592 [Uranotaenia lowii]|uniref:uncharacterized protein LOC129744998 n=1 Tax=Uranotaenia lowii TaxID=190385 RepID=UPI00247A71E1|nr:uncharacterized protein LOC129744998 [Uranotaenia lowii]XP_055596303.1 uncharacterized protein LOC129746592 [Uranotaenia lowii]
METPNSQTTTQNVVTVPIPILPAEGTYAYVFVKGSLYARDSAIFGCSADEVQALSKRFQISSVPIDNGVLIKVAPSLIINSLAQLGYKVVSSTGEAEIVWTLQREL